MSLPLLLTQVPKETLPVVLADAIADFHLDDIVLKQAMIQAGTWDRTVGYIAECALSGTAPDLDRDDLSELETVVFLSYNGV